MQSNIFKHFTLASFTLIGLLSYQTKAQALNLLYDADSSDVDNGSFVYDIELDPDETISEFNFLLIDGLDGIDDATANNIYTSPGNSDPFSVNFSANTNISSSDPRTYNNVITLLSTSKYLGDINYLGVSSIGVSDGTILGPVASPLTADSFDEFPGLATAVPFEFSPGLGVIISTGFLGMHLLRRKKPFSV
jgi:hypothetical protein